MLSKSGFRKAATSLTSRKLTAPTHPAFLSRGAETQVSKTSNGVRVASEFAYGETAAVGVWIDAGSRYETTLNNGAAHFLEHMAFKGTEKRTREMLEVEVENMGGHLNAYTSREQTVYFAKVFKDDVPQAMELLSDILQNSKLLERDVTREKDVILRESAEVAKEYQEVVLDRLHEACFRGTGLGLTILGPESNITKMTRDDLQSYIGTHYTSERFVIAGAGAVDHDQLVDLTEKYFGNLPRTPANGSTLKFDPAVFTGSDLRIQYKTMTEAHIALAFQGGSWTSEYALPLMIIQTILGSWDPTCPVGRNTGSRLVKDISDRDLASSFMTFNTCYKDTGLFGIYLVCDEDKAEDAVKYSLENLLRLSYNITDEEVSRAKTQLKASLLMQLDSFSSTAEDIGRQMLTYGRRMSNAEMFARIDKLSTDDIKITANRLINDEDHVLAAIGTIGKLPDYNWIREKTFHKH